jgi:tRNA-2-methylthio-N6-dimethylallyladenosine synthase
MFYYSERPGTLAQRKFVDDIPLNIKKQRLQAIIEKQTAHSLENNKQDIGKTFEVLVEKVSRRSSAEFGGRTSQNKMVIFPSKNAKIGDYVMVKVHNATSATLLGDIIED